MRCGRLLGVALVLGGLSCASGRPADEGASGETAGTETSSSTSTGGGASDGSSSGGVEASSSESTGEASPCDAIDVGLGEAAQAYVDAYPVVGLVAAVQVEGCVIAPWVAGEASREGAVPLESTHLLRAGSVTKTLTAATIMTLVEDGLLSLEDPLSTWFPDVEGGEDVTVELLLQHRSGLASYTDSEAFQAIIEQEPTYAWTEQELVELTLAEDRVGAPGEVYHYSNTNYVLAGMIIAAGTGDTYANAVRTRVLEPAGLEHTAIEGEEALPGVLAAGHVTLAGMPSFDATPYYHPSMFFASGAAVSTADDLARFAASLFEGEWLTPASRAAMIDFVPTGTPGIEAYGLGLFPLRGDAIEIHAHNGAVIGFQAALGYEPRTGTGIAVMQNDFLLGEDGELLVDPIFLVLEIAEAVGSALER